jgi:hypothetical protein
VSHPAAASPPVTRWRVATSRLDAFTVFQLDDGRPFPFDAFQGRSIGYTVPTETFDSYLM